MNFNYNQIIMGEQPTYRLAADWCNENNAMIVALSENSYQITAIPGLSFLELATKLRTERDARITACDWVITRHRDELDEGDGTTLTPDEYAAWLVYRKALRDLPSVDGFPWSGGDVDDEDCPWPVEPIL